MEAASIAASGPARDTAARLEAPSRASTASGRSRSCSPLCALLSVATTVAIVVSLLGPTIELLRARRPNRLPVRHRLVAELRAGQLRRPADRRRHAQRHALGHAVRDPDRARRGDLPERVRHARGSAGSSSRCSRSSPASRPSPSASSRVTFITPGMIQPLWPGFLGACRASRSSHSPAGLGDRADDRPDHRLDLRGRDVAPFPTASARAPTRSARPKAKVATRVVFPAALSGIVASIVLGDLARRRRDDDRPARRRLAPEPDLQRRTSRSRR